MKRIKLAFSLSAVGVFFFGITLTTMVFFGLESQNEHNFLDRAIAKIESSAPVPQPGHEDDEFIQNAVHFTHYLLQRRTEIFQATRADLPIKERMFHSPIRAAIDGYGDCGGYSVFLISLLSRKGYDVKACQMKVDGIYGGHVTVCVQLPGRLVVVDPLYDETFTDANGNLSDIRTVAAHWSYYRSRITDPEYQDAYDYSKGYRFTNWDKFGPVTRGMHATLAFFGGKEWADTLSFRPYIADTYKIGFFISAFYVLLFLMMNSGKILGRIQKRYFHREFKVTYQPVMRRQEAA